MRNLRRFYAVAIAIAMLVGMLAPVAAFAAGSDYAADANVLHNLGLYQGIDKDKFNPDLDSTLNRQTAATMVLRMFGLEQAALDMDEKDAKAILADKFKDASSVDGWALKQVAYAVDNDIIKGFPDGTFQPKGLLTGRQYCTLVLKNLGYTDFTFEAAGKKFAEVSGASAAEQAAFDANSAIKKNILVGISRKALDAKMENGKVTLIQQLVNEKAVTEKAATDAGYGPFAPAPTTTPTATTAPSSVPSTVYGTVNVSATMTAATTVAKGQPLFEVGKVTFKAVQDTVINGLKVTRSGLSADTDISSVSAWDGVNRLNTPATVSNNLADITFTSPMTLKAGDEKVVSLKINVASTTTASGVAVFSIADAKAIKTNATVTGTFPMASGALTFSSVTLGNLTVTVAGDAPSTGNVDVKNDVRMQKIKVQVNNEDMNINSITFTQSGSISDSDVANLKLYNGTNLVGTVPNLVNRKASFTFSPAIKVLNGGVVYFELKGDIISGSSRTIAFDIADVNDIQATGITYGAAAVADNAITSTTVTTTLKAPTLTINTGSLLYSLDAQTPAAATVGSTATDSAFTSIKLQATGETVTITRMKIQVTATSAADTLKVTSLKINAGSANAATLANPYASNTGSSAVANPTVDVALTNPIDVVPGTPVVVNLLATLTNATAGVTYTLGLPTDTSYGIKYNTKISGKADQLLATTSLPGNIMTVGTVAVTAEQNPVSYVNVFPAQSNVKVASFKLSHNLSESVNVSNLHLAFSTGGTPAISVLRNLRLTDVNGNVISDTVASPSATQTLTFTNPITIKNAENVIINALADIASTSSTGNFAFGLNSSSVAGTATTVANGTSVTFASLSAPTLGTNNNVINLSAGVTAGTTAFSVVASGTQKVGSGVVYKGQTNVKLAGYTFKSLAAGVEDTVVSKMVLSPVTAVGVQEVRTLTITGAATGTANFGVVLNGAGAVNTAITSGDSAATIATAIAADTGARWSGAGWTVTNPSSGVVLFTKTAVGAATGTYSVAANTTGVTSTFVQTTAGTDGITLGGVQEVRKVSITSADSAGGAGTITVTLNGVAGAAVATTGAESATTIATNIATSGCPAGWTATANNGVLTFVKTAVGSATGGAYSIAKVTCNATVSAFSQVMAGSSNTALTNQYVQNIKIKDANGNLLADVGTLNGPTTVTLSNPFTVPAFNQSLANTTPVEISIFGDISADAPAAMDYAIRLGNNTAQDIKYTSKTTGIVNYISNTNAVGGISNGVAAEAIFTTGLSNVTIASNTPVTTSPKGGTVSGVEVGRFTVTNNGTTAIKLNKVTLAEIGGFNLISNACTLQLYSITDSKVVSTTADLTGNSTVLFTSTGSNEVVIQPGAQNAKVYSVKISGACAAGTTITLKADKTGTTYSAADDSVASLRVSSDCSLDGVSFQ